MYYTISRGGIQEDFQIFVTFLKNIFTRSKISKLTVDFFGQICYDKLVHQNEAYTFFQDYKHEFPEPKRLDTDFESNEKTKINKERNPLHGTTL